MKDNFTWDFINIYRTEWLKTRKTLAFWLVLLYPLLCTLLVSLKFLSDKQQPSEPWAEYIKEANNVMSFFLPHFCILIVSFATQIEYKNYGWKQIYSQPVSRTSIFLGKYVMLLSMTILSMIVAFFIIYFTGLIIHLIKPGLNFQITGFAFDTYLRLFFQTFLASIFIITLQYWICLRIKGFLPPIIAGIFFTIIPIAYMMILGISGLIQKGKDVFRIFEY
ncbi:MAG: ABC transporter permease, partial [Bacteroidota bacterium]|nr:ABC transporter permease [Bacteroidota bacterium]